MEKAKEKQKERNERGGEKMKNSGKRKYQKGITLIALVITIIVLLILAAVSIATLTGENGILSKANTAKEETQREDAKEQAKLDIATYVTDDLAKGGDGSITNEIIKGILTGKDYVEGNPGDDSFTSKTGQEIPYSELYGKIGDTGGTGGSLPSETYTKPYLPSSEFSQKEGTTLETGLVIVDKAGNSYVWIEVPKTETVYATAKLGITKFTETEYTNIEQDLQNYAKDYRKENYVDEWYAGEGSSLVTESTATSDDLKQLKTGCGLSLSEYKELKNKMLKSVYENGGFWIGQYEMGYELKEGETVRYFDDQREHLVDKSPVCKEGAYPYNFVTCKQAQGLASSMKSGNYTSSLMFGIQWDLVMKFIETKEGKTQDELKKDSKDWGNYQNVSFDVTKGKYSTDKGQTFTEVIGSYTKPARTDENEPGILLTTGASERNSVLNIYDIAGNVYEFTLEKYTVDLNYPCCVRGGKNSGYGNKYPAYIHDYGNASNSFNFTGFRSALY